MPVVAGNLPYTGVPTVEPSTAAATPFQNIRATADEFGGIGAEQLTRLGAQLGQSADTLASTATFLAHVDADKASNDYQDYETKLLYGDPADPTDTGFFGKQGQDAINAMPDVRNKLLQARENFRKGLPNNIASLDFDAVTRRQQAYTLQAIGRHFVTESKEYAVHTAAAGVEAGMNKAAQALARGADAEAEAAVGEAMRKFRTGALAQGYAEDSDFMNNGYLKIRGDFVRQKVDELKKKNPVAAQIYFDNNIDALPHAEVMQLRDQLFTAARAQQAEINAGNMPGTTSADRAAGRGLQSPQSFNRAMSEHGMSLSGTGEGHVAPKTERLAYIRAGAIKRGLNADAIEMTVANEGLHAFTGDSGKSFGDFQLYTGGGLGNEAEAAGVKIRDPRHWKEADDFALDQMAAHKGDSDWFAGQWHGPRDRAPWAVANFSNPGASPTGSTVSNEKEAPVAKTPEARGYRAYGDSLGVHLINKAGIAGLGGNGQNTNEGVATKTDKSTAVAGIGPPAVAQILREAPASDVKGQDIIISSGASNVSEPGAMSDANLTSIAESVYWAKYKGAKSVTLLGVADPFKSGEARNQQLAQVAAANGAAFTGAIPQENWAKDNVHTKRPAGMLDQVKAAQTLAAPQQDTTLTGTPSAAPGVRLASNDPDQVIAQPIKPLPKLNFALPDHDDPSELPDSQLPGMADKLEQIMKNVPANDVLGRQDAVKAARRQLNQQYQEQQRRLRLHNEEVKATSEATKRNYIDRFFKEAVPETEISSDRRLTSADAENMIRFQREMGKGGDPDPKVSAANTATLYNRMTSDGPDKITTEDPLNKAYAVDHLINKQDFEFLQKEFRTARTELGETLKNTRDRWNHGIEHIIAPKNALNQYMDDEGGLRYSYYVKALDEMITASKKSGKSGLEIFAPTDPNDPYSSPAGQLLKAPQFMTKLKRDMIPPPPIPEPSPYMGIGEAVLPPPIPPPFMETLKTPEDVKAQVGKMFSYREALEILKQKFGIPIAPEAPVVPR